MLTCCRKRSKEESVSCIRGILSCDVTKLDWKKGERKVRRMKGRGRRAKRIMEEREKKRGNEKGKREARRRKGRGRRKEERVKDKGGRGNRKRERREGGRESRKKKEGTRKSCGLSSHVQGSDNLVQKLIQLLNVPRRIAPLGR